MISVIGVREGIMALSIVTAILTTSAWERIEKDPTIVLPTGMIKPID